MEGCSPMWLRILARLHEMERHLHQRLDHQEQQQFLQQQQQWYQIEENWQRLFEQQQQWFQMDQHMQHLLDQQQPHIMLQCEIPFIYPIEPLAPRGSYLDHLDRMYTMTQDVTNTLDTEMQAEDIVQMYDDPHLPFPMEPPLTMQAGMECQPPHALSDDVYGNVDNFVQREAVPPLLIDDFTPNTVRMIQRPQANLDHFPTTLPHGNTSFGRPPHGEFPLDFAPVDNPNEQANFDGRNDFDYANDQADFDGTNNEADFDGTNNEADFDGTNNEADFDGTNNEADFDGTNNEADFDGTNNEADFDDANYQADFDDTNYQADFDDTNYQAEFDDITDQADFADPNGEADFADPNVQADFADPNGQADHRNPNGQANLRNAIEQGNQQILDERPSVEALPLETRKRMARILFEQLRRINRERLQKIRLAEIIQEVIDGKKRKKPARAAARSEGGWQLMKYLVRPGGMVPPRPVARRRNNRFRRTNRCESCGRPSTLICPDCRRRYCTFECSENHLCA